MLGTHPLVRVVLDRGEAVGLEARSPREQPLGVDRLVERPDRRRTHEQRDRVGRRVLEQPSLVDRQLALGERQPREQRRPLRRVDPGAAEPNVAAAVTDEPWAVIAIGAPPLR